MLVQKKIGKSFGTKMYRKVNNHLKWLQVRQESCELDMKTFSCHELLALTWMSFNWQIQFNVKLNIHIRFLCVVFFMVIEHGCSALFIVSSKLVWIQTIVWLNSWIFLLIWHWKCSIWKLFDSSPLHLCCKFVPKFELLLSTVAFNRSR